MAEKYQIDIDRPGLDGMWECNYCDALFVTKEARNRHERKVHNPI